MFVHGRKRVLYSLAARIRLSNSPTVSGVYCHGVDANCQKLVVSIPDIVDGLPTHPTPTNPGCESVQSIQSKGWVGWVGWKDTLCMCKVFLDGWPLAARQALAL